MADIVWNPPPGILPASGAGWSVATLTSGNGRYDASSLETLSSFGTQGYLFAVGQPHFPRYDSYPPSFFTGPAGEPYYGHSTGFWISPPATDSFRIDTVPDHDLWSYVDFQFWKLAQTDPPYPIPNGYQGYLLAGQYSYLRGDCNTTGSDITFAGITLHPYDSLLYVAGNDGNPFDGSAPGSLNVGWLNPNHRLNHGYLPQPTKIQMVLGQVYGNVHYEYRPGRNGLLYPYRVYDTLDFWYPPNLYYLYKALTDPDGEGIPPIAPRKNKGTNPASLRKRDWKNHGKFSIDAGKIYFYGNDIASPLYGWPRAQKLVASDADKEVHGGYDSRGILYCLYDHVSGTNRVVKQVRSDDDGATWGATTFAFQSQTYTKQPRFAELDDGGILRCAFVPDMDTTATPPAPKPTGRIIGVVQHSGERIDDPANPLPEFFLRDDSGQDYVGSVDLQFQDSGYDIIAPAEEPGRYYLCATPKGGSGNTDYWSSDFGRTWKKIVTQTTAPG